ncbi:glutathionylspermidine synthase family protein [Catenulispora rubra]|uniref:glutathionylspermidine synthase family protein n=1 Tax=Catenulispora rubra TaxID=280293 RepID=UPI001892363A|nr:glutathionylspermidine synthase family protein [Catenulispora rubra]
MRRVQSKPREGWQQAVESQGLVFPVTTMDDGRVVPYWYESAHYTLTTAEVDALEDTTAELHAMCLAAAEHIVSRDRFADLKDYVAKPLLGREGASIRIVTGGEHFEQPGHYGREGYVYQEFSALPAFPGSDGGGRAVLGSWLVDGEPAGLGIRESDGLVTDTYARFVPHVIDG